MPPPNSRDIPKYRDVLARAHEKYSGGLNISVELLQIPSEDNNNVAISRATVVGIRADGYEERWIEIGDAATFNCGRMIHPHIIRMAGTRAKARALKDAIGEGDAVEEEFGEGGDEPSPYSQGNREKANRPPAQLHKESAETVPSTPTEEKNMATDAQVRYITKMVEDMDVNVEEEYGPFGEMSVQRASEVAKELAARRRGEVE